MLQSVCYNCFHSEILSLLSLSATYFIELACAVINTIDETNIKIMKN